jgi:anaerobic magnesium-protoporphyrin IX monomethyl ester cyclase
VRLLRRHNIMSIVDYIVGLEEETPRTIWRGLRGLLRYDGDFVNALYITPHAWTPLGRAMSDAPLVERDTWKWDYRHQIVAVKHLTPTQLFLGVKLVELLYHLHPRRLARMLAAPDPALRAQLRFSFRHTTKVFCAELLEHAASRVRARRQRQHAVGEQCGSRELRREQEPALPPLPHCGQVIPTAAKGMRLLVRK